MKTTSVPLIGEPTCPNWHENIPSERLEEFKVLVAQVHREIWASAGRSIVAADDPLRWHDTLFRDFVPLRYYAGHYRGEDSVRPCLNVGVRVGDIRGCPPSLVRAQVDDLFVQIRRQIESLELRWSQLSPRARAMQLSVITANLVGGFVRIHPFINGNGRTSRLLWRWCLARFGVPVQCCTHPRPNPPYGQIMKQAMRGDYRDLALYVLEHLRQNAPSQN